MAAGDHIKYKKGYKYQLAEGYRVQVYILPVKRIETDYLILDTNGWLTIKKGYAWDGASGPTYDSSDSMRGALVHDALYQLLRMGLLDECYRSQADQLLHDICTEDGMMPFRADVWEFFVEVFAASAAAAGSEQPILTAP